MPVTTTPACTIRAVCSSVPERLFDNLNETTAFDRTEVAKVVRMAGVQSRHIASERICSSDLCAAAAQRVLEKLEWDPRSIDALIFVTQSQDYLLPSTSCLVQHWLGLSDSCAAFDVGLGCSGYPYGLWLASMMLATHGFKRVLMLHGETPTRFSDRSDRSVALLFGDAGSATALEAGSGGDPWWFALHTDGSGWRDLIIEGGGFRNRFPADPRAHFVSMNGAGIFNFAIRSVPSVIQETLAASSTRLEDLDYIILHQSNLFIMRHLIQKMKLPESKIPFSIQRFGSAGGPSVPLTMTQGNLQRPADHALRLLLVGYGVGLSWGTAIVSLAPDALLDHVIVSEPFVTSSAAIPSHD
jgi:3-oxoacyl-[acyl-carrier-protein] synthase-3